MRISMRELLQARKALREHFKRHPNDQLDAAKAYYRKMVQQYAEENNMFMPEVENQMNMRELQSIRKEEQK